MARFTFSTNGNINGRTAFLTVTCDDPMLQPYGPGIAILNEGIYMLYYMLDPNAETASTANWELDFEWNDRDFPRFIDVEVAEVRGGRITSDRPIVRGQKV